MATVSMSAPIYVVNIRSDRHPIRSIDTSGWTSAGLRSYVKKNMIVVGLVFYEHDRFLPENFGIIDYEITEWTSISEIDTINHKTSIVDMRWKPDGRTGQVEFLIGWMKEDYLQWKLTA